MVAQSGAPSGGGHGGDSAGAAASAWGTLSISTCGSQPRLKLIVHTRIVDDQRQARTLWLVRHGQTTWNSMGWVQGQVDEARFTRSGKREIRYAANLLAGEQVAAVYSSDLFRARRTAMAIANRLDCHIQTDPRLRERKFGIAEGVPWVDVPTAVTGVAGDRVIDETARPPGGESLRNVYIRCLDFMWELAHRSEVGDVVVVAHDGSLRMLRAIIAAEQLAGLKWESSLGDDVAQPVALAWQMPLDEAS